MRIESAYTQPAPWERKPDAREAATQFEALVISQFLGEATAGWTSGEGGNDAILDFAQQKMAGVIAANGGLGLATAMAPVIERQEGAK